MTNNYYIIIIIIIIIITIIIITDQYYGNYYFNSLSKVDYKNINLELLNSYKYQKIPIKLYYINMNKSIDRNKRFLNRMNNYSNYDIIRFEAYTPEDLNKYNIKIPWYCKSMHNKEKACLLSHLKAIELSYKNNDNYSIIAEDDMIIEKNINWDYFINILPDDWDIIQLYYFKLSFYNSNYFKQLQKQNILIKTNNILTSAAAYLINKKGMKKIMDNLIYNNTIDLRNHNRHCLADYVIFNNLNRYILTYPIIKTEEIDSTLNPSHIFQRRFQNIL